MNPSFFVADPINALASSCSRCTPVNKVSIRVQPSGNIPDESDILLFFFTVANDAEVAAAAPRSADRRRRDQQCARNADAQPDLPRRGGLRRTLVGPRWTWQSFGGADATNGVQFGESIGGDLQLRCRRPAGHLPSAGSAAYRSAPAAGGHLTGSFDLRGAPGEKRRRRSSARADDRA